MKKISLIIVIINLFLFANKAFSQDIIDEDFLEKIDENAKLIWDENIPAFNINVEPALYKNESAVVIGWKRNVNFDKKSNFRLLGPNQKSLIFIETIRFKIKLNDKNAINDFSEIYFRYSDNKDGFSARIIKPDGSKNPVSLSSAVGIENSQNVPEFYQSFFDLEYSRYQRYFKVAIPDLEIGDVLEYVTLTKSKLDVTNEGYVEFTPQYEICNKAYPVLFNQISIETDDKSYFKALSKNGAPNFIMEESSEKGLFKIMFLPMLIEALKKI